MENIRNILESLLFVADEPLSVAKLKTVLETADTKEIKTALHSLADQYEARGGGFGLAEVAGGWQLRTRPEYNEWVKRLLQPPPQRLSKAALETLAIVAYNQPIIRADIEHIRGVDCGGILRQLMERKLIRVLGRKEIPGRPLIYATTKLFLELFDLKDLKDLPTPKEIEEMGAANDAAAGQPADAISSDVSGTALDDLIQADLETTSDSVLIDPATPQRLGKETFARRSASYSALPESQRHEGSIQPSGIGGPPHPIPGGIVRIASVTPTILPRSNRAAPSPQRIAGSTQGVPPNTATIENNNKTADEQSDKATEKP